MSTQGCTNLLEILKSNMKNAAAANWHGEVAFHNDHEKANLQLLWICLLEAS